MKRRTAAPVPGRIIKVGGLYHDMAWGLTVIAEDHEIRDGQRTGRILVHTADGKGRFPRRYYTPAADLAEIRCDAAGLVDTDDGAKP